MSVKCLALAVMFVLCADQDQGVELMLRFARNVLSTQAMWVQEPSLGIRNSNAVGWKSSRPCCSFYCFL